MLMTPVGDHGVQRAATGRSEGGEEPQSLGQHVTDMGKPAREKQSIEPPLRVRGLCHMPPEKAFSKRRAEIRLTASGMLHVLYFHTWDQGRWGQRQMAVCVFSPHSLGLTHSDPLRHKANNNNPPN